jgi:phage-related minor tail protein
MSLEASSLTINVVSQGISDATKALEALAKAGDAAEKGTSNIGKGAAAASKAAQDSAKAGVDAAQQAASQYNAIIDMMTEKSKTYYADKAAKAAIAAQQELFDGMSVVDKLWAHRDETMQKEAAARAKESADIRAQQQSIMDAAIARYAAEQELANKMNASYDKRVSTSVEDAHAAAIIEDKKRAWQALGQVQSEAIRINKELDAAQKRVEDDHGRAILEDKRRAWKALGQAQSEAQSINAKLDRDSQQAKADGDAFVAMLKKQAETVGLTTKELREYNAEQLRTKAAQLGVSQQVEQHIQTLQKAKGPHESFNLLTAGSARELMVLGHELSQGSFQRFGGSLIVLGERINFLPSLLEKAGAAAAFLGVGLGVLIAAIAAVVALVATSVIAYNKSSTAMKEMRNEVILTGGSIGATGDQLYAMSNRIGEATGNFGKAREAVLGLAATGRFTAEQINMIAEAAVGMEKYGGVAIENTIKQFERLAAEPLKAADKAFKGVSDAAMQLDQQLHFLEPTVLAEIMHLERIGDVSGASKVAISALAEEEKSRIAELKSQLTPLGAVLDTIGEKASKMWHNLFHKESMQDQLQQVSDQITETLSHLATSGDKGWQMKHLGELMKLSNDIQGKMAAGERAAADKAAKVREDNETKLGAIQLRNLFERSKSEESFEQRKMKFEENLAKQRAKAAADPAYAKAMEDLISPSAEKSMLEKIKKDSMQAEKKPRGEGLSGIDEQIAAIASQYDVQKRIADNEIKLIDAKNKAGLLSDSAAERAKSDLLDQEATENVARLDKELAVIDAFHTKDVRLANEAAKKRADIEKQLTIAKENIQLKKDLNGILPDARAEKEQQDADAASQKVIEQTAKQTMAIQNKIDAYNRLPESVRAAGITEKQMQDEITQSEIDWYDQKIASIALLGPASDEEIKRLTAEKNALKQKTAAQKEWETIQAKNNAALNQPAALNKVATEQIKMWKDAGNEIEKSLTRAFGNAGKAAGQMFKAFAEGQASQIDMANQIGRIKADKSLDEATKAKQINDLQLQGAQQQLGSYGNMADAAKGFFDENSKGYEAMTKAAMILHTAEVALSLIKGVNAILTQGEGDPYSAFARMAAMTAMVAALGVAVTGGGSGGMSSADQQSVQGTGSVLGSPTKVTGNKVELVGQKSESIAKSLSILEKNSGLGLVVQNDMLDAMRKLNDNISAFAVQLVRSTNVSNPDVHLNTNNGLGKTVTSFLLGGPIGLLVSKIPVIGNILGKIGTSIFGGKQTLDDSGFTLGKTSLGNVAANGVNAQSYAKITTSGGWFHGDSHDTKLSSLGADANNQFTQVILSMSDTLKTAATALGMDGDEFNRKLQSFVIDIGNVSFKGMTGDQIQTTLQNIFSKLSDQMATFAFSDLQKYQKIGEGLMETVTRVANDLMQVKDVFDVLSKTIPKGMAAIAASEQLITQFGSVDNLTKGVKAYMSAIYSDQQKLDPVIKSVNTAMASLGLSSVKTKQAFKDVVDGADITTEAGAKLFATLMNIAPAFGQIIDEADKVKESAVSDARSALTDAYNREAEAIQNAQSNMEGFVKTLKNLQKSTLLGDLSPLTAQQKYLEAKSQFDQIAKAAQGGDVDAQGKFEGAYTSFLEASKLVNASGEQYQQDFLYAQKVTQEATSWAEKQVDAAKAALDALNKQVEGMLTLNNSILTVTEAINKLIEAQGTGATDSASNRAQKSIESLYGAILQRHSDTEGMQFWSNALMNGVSLSHIASEMASSPEARGLVAAPTTAITPVTALQSSSNSSSSADIAVALSDMKVALDEVKATIAEGNQSTVGAIYDSQDKAADKTVDGFEGVFNADSKTRMYKVEAR